MTTTQVCSVALIDIIEFPAFSLVRIFLGVAFQVVLLFFLNLHNLIKLELVFAFFAIDIVEIDLIRAYWPLLYRLEISVRLCINLIDQIKFLLHKVVPTFSRTVRRTHYVFIRLFVLGWLVNLDTLLNHFSRQNFIAKLLSKLVKLFLVAMLQVEHVVESCVQNLRPADNFLPIHHAAPC